MGSRKDSQTYVRNKKKCCDEVGIVSYGTDLPETATEEEVLEVVEKYNADPRVHGILVQLPLPKHINEEKVMIRRNKQTSKQTTKESVPVSISVSIAVCVFTSAALRRVD